MPPEEHKTVFISYRRKISPYIARAIFEHLNAHNYNVFMDVESMGPGLFGDIILNQIKARAHFLVILSPGSLENCVNPGDWMRREIEFAIEQERNIVPVMTEGFKFEDNRDYLAGKLSKLSDYNGLTLYHEHFSAIVKQLRTRFLDKPLHISIHSIPIDDEPEVQRKLKKTAEQPAPTKKELVAEEHFWNGLEKQEASDLDGAIADYTEAIRLNPQYAAAYNNRGTARADQGDRARAIADFDETILLDPQFAMAYYNRGLAHKEQGNLDRALADLDEAIRLNPQFVMAYNNRGTARVDQGDLDGAIADYDEALRLNPESAMGHNNRGITRYHQNDLEGAIADYNEAIRLEPQKAAFYNNRGEVYFAQKQYKLALADFERSVEMKSDSAMNVAGLAIVLHALDQVDQARAQWQELIVQDTRYRDADWVGKELNWHPALIEEARKLIDSL